LSLGHFLRKGSIAEPPARPDPEQAWKTLGLINDWLKHAEAKLAAALATTGVGGGVLFNLVTKQGQPSVAVNVAAAVCGITLFGAGVLAIIGLFPVVQLGRRQQGHDLVNPLFFHDIACAYMGDAPGYSAVLHRLTIDFDDLVGHLGRQVHANAIVADRKYRWAKWSLRALLIGLLALWALAVIIARQW
jgi:hypothetical protein